MKLTPSDPSIATVCDWIELEELNLQPDFQRGEVWSKSKKQRLIDSILRDWYVPPIHIIIVPGNNAEEVLDGQQRLVAIRDFRKNLFAVDGSIPPIDNAIKAVDGCRYGSLPPEVKRRFDRFPLRIFRISDYKPTEPSELFYRLNQMIGLTSAETRNAFFGPARHQVKEVAAKLDAFGLTDGQLGFSNSRMAFDDTIAKLCYCIERKTIRTKVTAHALAEAYRSPYGFSTSTIAAATSAVEIFAECFKEAKMEIKFNKATLLSWLWFVASTPNEYRTDELRYHLSEFIRFFESIRVVMHQDDIRLNNFKASSPISDPMPALIWAAYIDRSASRVSDASSVIIRDISIWFAYTLFLINTDAIDIRAIRECRLIIDILVDRIREARTFFEIEESLESFARLTGWGDLQ